ncbi:MAG: hypothetical protein R3C41_16350 [Calditrichia bacterium]
MLREELKHIPDTRKDLRNFGLVVGGVFAAIGGYLFWRNSEFAPYLIGFGGFLIIFGIIFPPTLKSLQRAWMTLAVIMGFVMTRVFIAALFFGDDAYRLDRNDRETISGYVQWQPGKIQSYWKYRKTRSIDRKSFEQQF